jgi:hypothetical protein
MTTPPAPESLPIRAESDVREAGRVVATVILAAGPASEGDVERASRGLARLGRPPLAERDLVVSTPEQLAPLIPPSHREGLAALLIELSEGDPLRRRVALAYLGLWQIPPPPPPAARPAPPAARVARWIVGALPRHQETRVPEDRPMIQGTYRTNDHEPEIAPPVRDPLRARVERIRSEYLDVAAAVERVVIGKREVVEKALTALAARGHVLFVDAPGVGKTQLCKAIAAAIGVRFGRVQLTPDLLPMDVTGASTTRGARPSCSAPGRCSRTSCSPTRSTAPRPRPSRRCSR